MSALEIRPAKPIDSAAIAMVVKESWLDANRDLLPGDSFSHLAHTTHLGAMVTREWSNIRVACMDGVLVGAVGINPAGVIWMLYVLPGHQGCGAGSALYDAAIGALRLAGRRKALLEVLAANEGAVAFYRSRGWTSRKAAGPNISRASASPRSVWV